MITIRNIGHYIIFAMVVYIIGNATEVHTYKGFGNLIACSLVGGIIGAVFGFAFDWLQELFKVGKIDMKDVQRSAIGGLFGGALAFFVGSDFLFWFFTTFVTLVVILEFYFNFYLKSKK